MMTTLSWTVEYRVAEASDPWPPLQCAVGRFWSERCQMKGAVAFRFSRAGVTGRDCNGINRIYAVPTWRA